MIKPVRDVLAQANHRVILLIGFVLTVAVGGLDFLTGNEVRVSILYLGPMSLVAWYVGRNPGLLVAATSAIIWLLADIGGSRASRQVFIPYWNGAEILGEFVIVTLIVHRLRATYGKQVKMIADTTSLLKLLLDALPDAVYFKDIKRRHVIVNKGYEDFFGSTRQNMIGKTIEEFVEREEAEQSRDTDETVIETKTPLIAEHSWPDKSGDNRQFETRKFPIFDDEGEIIAVGGISRDITDHKRAEEALKETKERLQTIAHTMTEVFWMADVTTDKTIYISPGYERVWGRSVASLYEDPHSFLDAIHEADRERVIADLEVKRDGLPFDHEYPDSQAGWRGSLDLGPWGTGPRRHGTGHSLRRYRSRRHGPEMGGRNCQEKRRTLP